MKNLVQKLVGEPRLLNLMDFPHLFQRDVSLVIKKGATLDQERLDMISSLQDAMRSSGINMLLTDELNDRTDLILFGTFDEREALKDHLGYFNIHFSEDEKTSAKSRTTPEPTRRENTPSATPKATGHPSIGLGNSTALDSDKWIDVPGFQRLATEGIGLVLFRSATSQNILILLAGDNDGLVELSDMLSGGSLYGCVVKEYIAACPVSNKNSGYDSYDYLNDDNGGWTEDSNGTSIQQEETTSTPTPVG